MRKENTVEDQDRKTPEEEVDVEGHAHRDVQDVQDVQLQDDDVQAHAHDVQDVQDVLLQDDDVQAHALRDVQDVQDVMRGDEDVQDVQ
jgi:hypothetical protein